MFFGVVSMSTREECVRGVVEFDVKFEFYGEIL